MSCCCFASNKVFPLFLDEVDHTSEKQPSAMPMTNDGGDIDLFSHQGRDELPLHYALEEGASLEAIQTILALQPEAVKARNERDGFLPLHVAALHCKEPRVLSFLLEAYEAGGEARDERGNLPLHYAAKHVHSESAAIVKLLLGSNQGGGFAQGAAEKNINGYLPLHFALTNKDNINSFARLGNGSSNSSSSSSTSSSNDKEQSRVIQALLDAYPEGAKETTFLGALPLQIAIENRACKDIIAMLIKAFPIAASTKCNSYNYLLHIAIEHDSPVDVVDILLQANPQAGNKCDGKGFVPIHLVLLGLHTTENSKNNNKNNNNNNNDGSSSSSSFSGTNISGSSSSSSSSKKSLIDLLIYYCPEACAVKTKDTQAFALHLALSLLPAQPEDKKSNNNNNSSSSSSNSSSSSSRGVGAYTSREEIIFAILHAHPRACNEQDKDACYPLHIACRKSDVDSKDVVLQILACFPDASKALDKRGLNLPLHYAAKRAACLEVMSALLDRYPAGASKFNRQGECPLFLAIYSHSDTACLRVLLQKFPSAISEIKDKAKAQLPIHTAIERSCKSSSVLALLEAAPHLASEKDASGHTALHLAIMKKRIDVDVLDTLLQERFCPLERASHYLFFAIEKEARAAVVEAVLRFQPAIASKRREAYTSNSAITGSDLPLHFALDKGASREVLACLLTYYPQAIAIKGTSGKYRDVYKTAVQIAIERLASFDVMELLFEYNALYRRDKEPIPSEEEWRQEGTSILRVADAIQANLETKAALRHHYKIPSP